MRSIDRYVFSVQQQKHVHVIFGCVSLTEADVIDVPITAFFGATRLMLYAIALALAPVCGIFGRYVCDVPCISESFLWMENGAAVRARVCVSVSECDYVGRFTNVRYKSHKSQSAQIEFGIHPRRNNLFITTASSPEWCVLMPCHAMRSLCVCANHSRLADLYVDSLRIKRIYRNVWFLVTSK